MSVRRPRVAWESGDPAEVRTRWQALRDDSDAPHSHATAAGFSVWAAQFASPGALPLLRVSEGDAVRAYLPATATPVRAGALWLRLLRSPGNHYWSCGYPIVGTDVEAGLEVLLRELSRARTWDVLELGPMAAQGAGAEQLMAIAAALHMSPTVTRRTTDHGVAIAGTWKDYFAGRSAKLRKHVSSGERMLAGLGHVAFEEWTGGSELPARLEEFFRVEAGGWKGREGTAILSDPKTHAFYRNLALEMASRGWFRLHLLRVGERCIAGEYSLSFDRTLTLLKPGYDESLSKASPGHLLRVRVIQQLLDTSGHHTYSLGSVDGDHMGYKERWCNTSREYMRLRLFNPSTMRGRAAAAMQVVRRRLRPAARPSQPVAVEAL